MEEQYTDGGTIYRWRNNIQMEEQYMEEQDVVFLKDTSMQI